MIIVGIPATRTVLVAVAGGGARCKRVQIRFGFTRRTTMVTGVGAICCIRIWMRSVEWLPRWRDLLWRAGRMLHDGRIVGTDETRKVLVEIDVVGSRCLIMVIGTGGSRRMRSRTRIVPW